VLCELSISIAHILCCSSMPLPSRNWQAISLQAADEGSADAGCKWCVVYLLSGGHRSGQSW